ncbi:2-amino-4-hydroxy-6-hydroxymethyldihydropteridine diphosphokinase [bacterium]|nr:2-amino-4-hydroxy-6-hydroxymethyldihydropteridine diphosphokinase [bacterium]MCB9478008.1 2-amino-4-hydroxy-6-hydroxymethyldihydropteridine diphosphokinase [Deltaproteobacteria bacterium]
MSDIVTIYLGLGSSLGDRLAYLQSAVDGLHRPPEIWVKDVSPVYDCSPVGGIATHNFLNAIAVAETTLSPHAVLDIAHELERATGRRRARRWDDRTLDIDLLLYGDEKIDTDDLVVPPLSLTQRLFYLVPLVDIAPDLIDPRSGRLYREWMNAQADEEDVQPFEGTLRAPV